MFNDYDNFQPVTESYEPHTEATLKEKIMNKVQQKKFVKELNDVEVITKNEQNNIIRNKFGKISTI